MDVEAYLARMGYDGDRIPSAANLAALQRAHLLHVPYENLDVFYRRPHSLDAEDVYRKIVERRRGGYCFELNGLFNVLLRALGYPTCEYFARWLDGEKDPIPARRHRILRVKAGAKTWLVDVGVGQRAALTPLEYAVGVPQVRGGDVYRIVRDPMLGFVLERRGPEGATRLFSWDETPQYPIDFTHVHYALTHDPEAGPFMKMVLVHLNTATGTKFVFAPEPEAGMARKWIFASVTNGVKQVRELVDGKDRAETLAREFGIENVPCAGDFE